MPGITILAPNYFPETNAGAKRVTRLAEYLAKVGWDVKVVTMLPHHPQNRLYPGFEDMAGLSRIENGVAVTRIRPWLVPKESLPLRLASELVASLKLARVAWGTRRDSDLYLASSPYMFLGPLGVAVGRLASRPFVWDVRDLTWLYPRAAGKQTFGLDRVLEALMRRVAASSAGLTTATEGLFDYFVCKPPIGGVVPNGASSEVLEALQAVSESSVSPTSRPRAVYVGLFGYNHGLSTVVEAARQLPEADFVFVGDGPDKHLLLEAAADLPNIEILGYRPFSELVEVYRSATVLVSHVRKNYIFRWTQPAKLWEYMASGRPVVHAGEGEVIRILEEHAIARTVAPEDPQALANAVRELLQDLASANEMGQRGRAYVQRWRSSEGILADLEKLLLQVLETRRR